MSVYRAPVVGADAFGQVGGLPDVALAVGELQQIVPRKSETEVRQRGAEKLLAGRKRVPEMMLARPLPQRCRA
jgi:hypothetical protein